MASTLGMRNSDAGDDRGAGNFARGTKRPAESQFTDLDRFNKRLNALSIGGPSHAKSNLFIPKATSPVIAPTIDPTQTNNPQDHDDGSMQVDDTRDRVYIHDLDAELADVESDEGERLIFLPDIEKKLSRLPRQVLEHRNDHENQELVLYSLPKSLLEGEGHDSVRKAIIESRHRARAKAAEEARQQDMNCMYDQGDSVVEPAETAHGYRAGYSAYDPDEMDMD